MVLGYFDLTLPGVGRSGPPSAYNDGPERILSVAGDDLALFRRQAEETTWLRILDHP